MRRGGTGAICWRCVLGAGLTLVSAVAFGTVLWVAAYAIVNPPNTIPMARADASASWRALEDISPDLRRAVIASEDAKFCAHHGFDFGELRAAYEDWRAGGRLRGASTISQQTAKNVFLWNDRSIFRKGVEAWFTLWIELLWSKPRILEVYLNVAEFGDGVFGAEAGARAAFGRGADHDLALWRAARLAAALPAPSERDPGAPSDAMLARADRIADGARTVAGDGRAACVGG